MKEEKAYKRKEKFLGYWWQPENPDQQWLGKARWKTSRSPRLTLHYKSRDAVSPPSGNIESLLGLDRNRTAFSLLRVGQHLGSTAGLLSRKVYGGGHLLKGIHVARLEDMRINKVNVWLQYLGAWLGEEGFSDAMQDQTSRIEYRRPEDRSYQISPNVTLKLCHSSRSSTQSRQRHLTYDIFFSVEKKKPVNFNRAFRWINDLRFLLHFARLKRVKPTKITFEDFGFRSDLGRKSYPKEAELFSGAIGEPKKDPLFFDFVFTFNDVKDRFAEFCGKWFRFNVEQREAIGCYMTTVYVSLTDEVRLVCLTQALEAFHQIRFRPVAKSENAYFINRIKELCRRHDQRMVALVGEIDAFSTAVRDSRHYYTHHDPSIRQKGNVLSGSKLTLLTYHLQYLFRLCVLAEFGLDDDPHSMLRRQVPSRITEFY